MASFDVLVIGGGIAGASIGYELAADRTVGLLEMEPALAHHTTGRSIATFLESYGGPTIRLLTSASRAFMEQPPDGFEGPILKPLPLIWVAGAGQDAALREMYDAVSETVPGLELLDVDEAVARTRVMRTEWLCGGMVEPGGSEIDVAALHGGYVSGLRARGGAIHTAAGMVRAERRAGRWHVTDSQGSTHDAAVVVNAAGSWCDLVAQSAGVRPVGIHPLRRTIFSITPPAGVETADLPLTADIAGTFYFKPEVGQILCSPADEVPSDPCDARPEELDIARAIDVINEATTLDVRHVRTSWAGLRNFVADRSPVCGFDDEAEDFFWFVGQGGYGIQMSPALARAGAALVRSGSLPADLVARGLEPAHLHRARLAGLHGLQGH